MLILDINLEKTLAFDIEINGVVSEEMSGSVRFIYEGIEYGFPASIEEGKITSVIKPLKQIFPNIKNGTVVNAKLELNTETYYFVPWEGNIKIQAPVSVEAKIIEDGGGVRRPSVTVKAKSINERKKVVKENKKDDTWTKQKLQNITEKDIINYMKRSGTKNETIQQIVLNEATSSALEKGYKGNVGILREVVRALKKPK